MQKNPAPVLAILGRRDEPTDGVEDYCVRLADSLSRKNIVLELVRIPWLERGWSHSLDWLRAKVAETGAMAALVQYTALGWSRRGFPIGVLRLSSCLRRSGVRVAIVFHDLLPFAGTRLRDRFRREAQAWVMRNLARSAAASIACLPVEMMEWVDSAELRRKFVHIPIGSNVTESWNREAKPLQRERIVTVFGVTERDAGEATQIGRVVAATARDLGSLRLLVMGRGAPEAEGPLRKNLNEAPVTLDVHGILSAEEVGERLTGSSAMLFVRSGISAQRGSVIAGICCGLPIVGWADHQTAFPVTAAGIRSVPRGDQAALVAELTAVLKDEALRSELAAKSRAAARQYFSWDVIADSYLRVLSDALR